MSETNNNPNGKKFPTKAAAVVAGFLGGLAFLHGTHQDAPQPEPTGTYTVEKGDTFSGIAEKVAESTPEHETMQEAAENIRDINELNRYPDIAAGQELKVPTSADVDPQQAGVQLEESNHLVNTGKNPNTGEIEQIPQGELPPVEDGHTGTTQ